MTVFSATYACILNHCYDGNIRSYAASKELKTKEFTIKCENINQAIGIELTIILEIKLPNYIFLTKYDRFFCRYYVFFLNPCEDGNVHTHATTKELKKRYLRYKFII